jgi:hypothetical protein
MEGMRMTLKQFKQWCNERACDGCWGFNDAKFCIELLDDMNKIPWWRRKKVWNGIANRVEFAVVNPINKKIQEVYGERREGE